MRFSCASKAASDLPKATNTSPARVASAQGIERRSTKASGEKLSCVVLFTCPEGGREDLLDLACPKHDVAAIFPTHPAPGRRRGGGDLDARTLVMRERPQPLDLFFQREEQDRAERDDAALPVRDCPQGPQRRLLRQTLLQPERQITGMPWNGGQDSRLRILQSVLPLLDPNAETSRPPRLPP